MSANTSSGGKDSWRAALKQLSSSEKTSLARFLASLPCDREGQSQDSVSVPSVSVPSVSDPRVAVVSGDPRVVSDPRIAVDRGHNISNAPAPVVVPAPAPAIVPAPAPASAPKPVLAVKSSRPIQDAVLVLVKQYLRLPWKENRITRESYKTISKKTVDKFLHEYFPDKRNFPQHKEELKMFLDDERRRYIKNVVSEYVDRYSK